MAASATADLGASSGPDEIVAVRGARWYTVAFLVVGSLNYGYALLLTRLLDLGAYSRFAAGQGLILCASTVAVVAVPWVLAQSLARARSNAERGDAIRFAVVMAVGGGIVAGVAVAGVAGQFAGPPTMLALAGSTLLIFISTVTVGWLQGSERLRTLSGLTVGEAVVKCAGGVLLVSALGLGDAGALAAFGVGVLPCLFWWPSPARGGGRVWRSATANRDLWRRAVGIAGVQGLVAVIGATDLVLVTILPVGRSGAASYQASVVLARVPVFLASAISIAFFPSLSRLRSGTTPANTALKMYVIVALPIAAILATAPAAVLSAIFPAGYTMVPTLLRYTAIAGFAVGGLSVATTFFQARDDYSCLPWQAAGVIAYVAALLVGWSLGGVIGFAAGAACGAISALALMVYQLVRRQGPDMLGRMRLLEPLVLAGLLVLLRAHLALWLVAASAIGLRATDRFFRRSGTLEARYSPETNEPA
jgi:O-antigen/teichoic acid export membrane protein